ncbi:MAG: hypothetical protein V7745_06790 [Pseudomonadales bacterium]
MTDITIPVLCNANTGYSTFSEQNYTLENYNGLFISPRIDALNFRHRISQPGYSSSWHVAGDPTLIIIRSGILRISLRDGSYRDFSAGDIFIAKDKLPENGMFDEKIHGHTAQLIGEQELLALHIKLESL